MLTRGRSSVDAFLELAALKSSVVDHDINLSAPGRFNVATAVLFSMVYSDPGDALVEALYDLNPLNWWRQCTVQRAYTVLTRLCCRQ